MGKNLAFKGIKELEQVLTGLAGDKRLSNRVVNGILRKGAAPIVAEAKQRVQRKDGDTAKSIGVINGRGAGRGQQVYAGPRRGGPFKGYAGHLIEYGTAPRKKKDGTETGSMPAFPFMRPAFEAKKEAAAAIIQEECLKIIGSEFKSIKF